MNPLVTEATRDQLKKQVTDFRAGDTIRVAFRITEGEKERVQKFEGVCIRRRGSGVDETLTVRRVSYGVGMERIFPLHSPRVESIEVIRQGHARRAKLYFLRDLTGKKARLLEARRKRMAKGHMIDLEAIAPPKPEAPAEEEEESTPAEETAAAETGEKGSEAAEGPAEGDAGSDETETPKAE